MAGNRQIQKEIQTTGHIIMVRETHTATAQRALIIMVPGVHITADPIIMVQGIQVTIVPEVLTTAPEVLITADGAEENRIQDY